MGMMNNCVYRVKIHPRQTTSAFDWVWPAAGPCSRTGSQGWLRCPASLAQHSAPADMLHTVTSPSCLQTAGLRCSLSTPPLRQAPWAAG
jgi:hypothetical protein